MRTQLTSRGSKAAALAAAFMMGGVGLVTAAPAYAADPGDINVPNNWASRPFDWYDNNSLALGSRGYIHVTKILDPSSAGQPGTGLPADGTPFTSDRKLENIGFELCRVTGDGTISLVDAYYEASAINTMAWWENAYIVSQSAPSTWQTTNCLWALTDANGQIIFGKPMVSTPGTATDGGLKPGLYKLTETDGSHLPVGKPSLITLPMTDPNGTGWIMEDDSVVIDQWNPTNYGRYDHFAVHLFPKNPIIEVDKAADVTNTTAVGSLIDYTATVEIPNFKGANIGYASLTDVLADPDLFSFDSITSIKLLVPEVAGSYEHICYDTNDGSTELVSWEDDNDSANVGDCKAHHPEHPAEMAFFNPPTTNTITAPVSESEISFTSPDDYTVAPEYADDGVTVIGFNVTILGDPADPDTALGKIMQSSGQPSGFVAGVKLEMKYQVEVGELWTVDTANLGYVNTVTAKLNNLSDDDPATVYFGGVMLHKMDSSWSTKPNPATTEGKALLTKMNGAEFRIFASESDANAYNGLSDAAKASSTLPLTGINLNGDPATTFTTGEYTALPGFTGILSLSVNNDHPNCWMERPGGGTGPWNLRDVKPATGTAGVHWFAGTKFWVVETQGPDGYVADSTPKPVCVVGDLDGAPIDTSGHAMNAWSEDDFAIVNIPHNVGFPLPFTGDMTAQWPILIGLVAAVGAGAGCIVYNKKRAQARNA